MQVAKGQPPTDPLGIFDLWWHTPIIGWDGVTWGTACAGLVVLAVLIGLGRGGARR